MTTYYIYNLETSEVINTIETDNPDSFQFDYDWEICGCTTSPAFGCVDGLIK